MEYGMSNNCCKKQWSTAGKKEISSQEMQVKEAEEGGITTQKMAESSRSVYLKAQ